ncbi:MAG TPA: AarF/UbiB family protein [Longimicrobiaceae bacterium]|nr:AarF/UbiB family protein [Longimicrobiaceae bacterium]
MKYGRSDLVRKAGLDELVDEDAIEPTPTPPEAADLASDLEKMGPTFTKLGQLLSTRVDLLPAAYTDGLARLQDSVEPFDFAEVEQIVESELGVRLSRAFAEFESSPLAAASLGQVHRAVLRDGRVVAVKVQRPGVRERVQQDLEALGEIAAFLDDHTEMGRRYEFGPILAESRQALMRELDYREEAANLRTLSDNLSEFDRIVVPEPVADYTTSRVLTMDFIRGRKITSVSPLARMEMEGEALAEELFRAYLKQILVDGFFHADPHPGNVFLSDDGRIALLDVGMVGRVGPAMQDQLLRLLLAISEGHGEEAAGILVHIGEPLEGFSDRRFRRAISDIVVRNRNASAADLQIGRVILDVNRGAGMNGIRVPPELTLLGKTLLNLDQVGRVLDPDFEPNASIRRHAAELLQHRMLKNASPANVFSNLLEMNEFVQHLPGRLSRVLDAVAESEVEVKVRVMNESLLMEALQKVANRIALGLVLAALIVGAAMLMQVETTFRILGYPGLAILCFLGAAIGGVMLVINILMHDWRAGDDHSRTK